MRRLRIIHSGRPIAAAVLVPLLLAAFPVKLSARLGDTPFASRLSLGIELGYSQGLFYHHGFNILSHDGYRLHSSESGFRSGSNGYALVTLGYELSRRSVVAVNAGYKGVSRDERFFPLGLRYSFFPSGVEHDGFFSCADASLGFSSRLGMRTRLGYMAMIGEGYRFKLSPTANLDFILSAGCAFDSPEIPDPEGPGYVSEHNILSNFAGYYALNFSIALSF